MRVDSGLEDGGSSVRDGGSDAGVVDAGSDAGVVDAGSDAGVDAGLDAGIIDAGVIDAGTIDAGTIDAGTIDAGTIDAGTIDAGFDAGVDAGRDAGVPDAGQPDAGGPRVIGVRQISSGLVQTCGAMIDGGALCWGDNRYGSLGRNSFSDTETVPGPVVGVSNVLAVTTGYLHACAVSDAGKAWCWGSGLEGQLGSNNSDSAPAALMIFDGGVVTVAAAGDSTCVLDVAGVVRCAGNNIPGVDGGQSLTFVRVALDGSVAELVGGSTHECARFRDGGVQCWGDDTDRPYLLGSLSDGGRGPKFVPLPGAPTRLTAGFAGTCALYSDGGNPVCWGSVGELNGISHAPAPLAVSANQTLNVALVSACFVRDGGVDCFGLNDRAQLGRPGYDPRTEPLSPVGPVVGLAGTFTQIAGTIATVCALAQDTTVWCWGDDIFLSAGSGDPGVRYTPVHTKFPAQPLSLSHDTSCWLSDGGVECVGAMTLSSFLPATQVSVGYRHVLALYNGDVYGFGYSSSGELPVANTGGLLLQLTAFGRNVDQVAAGDNFSCLSRDGGVFCAGLNNVGQLGTYDGGFSVLTRVPSVSSPTKLRAGPAHTCALQNNASVTCWGNSGSGELGRMPPNASPGQFGALSCLDVQVGGAITAALDSMSNVYVAGSWGGGSYPVPTATSVRGAQSIAAATEGVCAVVNREVWCLGSNRYGGLGVDAGVGATFPAVKVPLQDVVFGGREGVRSVPHMVTAASRVGATRA